MKKNKGISTLVGFVLVIIGFMSLILNMVGIKFAFLLWVDALGATTGFVIRLAMIIIGFVVIYIAQTDFRGEGRPAD